MESSRKVWYVYDTQLHIILLASLLTLRQQIAPKAYPIELVAGSYHVVWSDLKVLPSGESEGNANQYGDAEIISYGADDPNFLSLLKARPELKAEPEVKGHEPYQMVYQFGPHDLSYSINFTDAVSTSLTRWQDSNTEWGPSAKIHFGIVQDDQGFPFLKFRATYTDPAEETLNVLESVAKKTDHSGLYSKDLTKNERLRLGFTIPEDQATRSKPETDDSAKGMVNTLERYTSATASQISKVKRLREDIHCELRKAEEVIQEAVNLSLDVPADPEPEERRPAGRPSKRKRTRN